MASSIKALRIGGEGREAEVDDAYFGGHIRPENLAAERIDRRLAENQSDKRQVVVAMRERGGRTLAQVFPRKQTPSRRSVSGLRRAPRFTPMRAPPGTHCTPASPCDGSTIRTVTASTAPARMVSDPSFLVCVAANSGITTTSPDLILLVTLRKPPGARICAASATASRFKAWPVWRWDAGLRSIFVALVHEGGLCCKPWRRAKLIPTNRRFRRPSGTNR